MKGEGIVEKLELENLPSPMPLFYQPVTVTLTHLAFILDWNLTEQYTLSGETVNKRSDTTSQTAKAKKALRQKLRQKRKSLTPAQQQQASMDLLKNLSSELIWRKSNHIAVYLARDGEIDPKLLVEEGWKCGKQFYLPVIDPLNRNTLTFLPWEPNTITITNKFGIPEPDVRFYKPRTVWTLDLVLLPLTGFDASGKRMGMGGGFYDRTFSFIGKGTRPRQPSLMGLAHECQRVDKIPVDNWDIPLSKIFTDQSRYP